MPIEAVLYGLPCQVSESWDATRAEAVVGAWQYVLVAIREQLTVEFSDSAVLTDAAGAITPARSRAIRPSRCRRPI